MTMDDYVEKVISLADEQLQEIICYIAYTLKVPEAVFHLMGVLEDSFHTFTYFPQR